MMNSLVSVIIPTYNRAQYIKDALLSVLGQSYKSFEIIVVDDGSTDDTETVLRPYTSLSNIKYIKQPNQGVSSARNTGIRAAKGEYIAFCDSDDLWTSNKLEIQVPWLDHFSAIGLVHTGVKTTDIYGNHHELNWNATVYNGKVTRQLFLQNFVSGQSALIRKCCLDKAGYFDESLKTSEDYDLWLRLSLIAHFFRIPDQLYIYRHWSGQVSSRSNKHIFIDDAFKVRMRFSDANSTIINQSLRKEATIIYHRELATMYSEVNYNWAKSFFAAIKVLSLAPIRFRSWKLLAKTVFFIPPLWRRKIREIRP